MTAADILAVLRRYWTALLACIAFGGLLGGIVGFATQSGYTGDVRVYAVNPMADNVSAQQQTIGVMRMSSYAQLATGGRLAERIIKRLDLSMAPEDLASSLQVATERDTVVMAVSMTGESEDEVRAILRVLPEELSAVLKEVSEEDRAGADAVTTFATIDGPTVGEARSLRSLLSSVLVGLVLGTVLGVVALGLLMRRNPPVRSPEKVSETVDAPIIGVMPPLPEGIEAEGDRQVAVAAHRLALSVRERLQGRERPVVAVTGTRPGMGATSVAVSLSRAFAERGYEVLHINASGADEDVDAFRSTSDQVRAVQAEGGPVVTLVSGPNHAPIGVVRVDPPSGSSTTAMDAQAAVSRRHGVGEVVVIDLPAINRIATSSAFFDTCDEVALVYSQRRSREREVDRALDTLDAICPAPVGLVANEGTRRRGGGEARASGPLAALTGRLRRTR